MQRESKQKLNLPPANSSKWNQINKDLSALIPRIFNKSVISSLSTSELSVKFDNWLYTYFSDNFGTVSPAIPSKNTRRKRPHKGLQRLRQRKKECKAARKALIHAGLEKTVEADLISKQWFSLVREHSKLKKALDQKREMKSRISYEKSFRIDPNKFAFNLFQGKQKNGTPTFSAETAKEYFEKTYRDEDRKYSFSALPEMSRPQLPSSFFSLRCPTKAEIRKSIRRKRNGATPGLNGLPYLPYKKCTAIQDFVYLLSQKVWKTRDVPSDWAEAFIVLLSKSDNLSTVSEFRPITIASTIGKYFSRSFQNDYKVLCCKTITSLKPSKKVF